MGTRNTADTYIFLILQDWTQGGKLEISSRVTATSGMSLCLPSPLLVKWGTRAHKQHFGFKTLSALCCNAAEGQAKADWRHRGTLMFEPKCCRAVPIAILIPQMSIAVPQHCGGALLWRRHFWSHCEDQCLRALAHGGRWSWRQRQDPLGSLIPCRV